MVTTWLFWLKRSLYVTCITCIVILLIFTDGECHRDETAQGCIMKLEVYGIYAAFSMIGIDCVLFSIFCYVCYYVSIYLFCIYLSFAYRHTNT